MPLPTRSIAETNSTWRCDHRADTESRASYRPPAHRDKCPQPGRAALLAPALVTLDDVAGAQTTERLPRVVARSAHAGGVCSLV